MVARMAKKRGGKVKIGKEQVGIYKITNFQNCRKASLESEIKLPND